MLLLGIMLISLQILAVDNDDAIRQQCEQEVGTAAQAGPAQAPYTGTAAGYPTVGMPTDVQPYQPQPYPSYQLVPQQTLQDLIAIFEGVNAAPQTVQDLVSILNEGPLLQRARQLANLALARDVDVDQLDQNLKLMANEPQKYFVEGYGDAQQQNLVRLLNDLGLSKRLIRARSATEAGVTPEVTVQDIAQRIREAHQEALQGGELTGQGTPGAIAAANINLDRLPMLAIELTRNPADAIHQAAVNPDMMQDTINLIRLMHDLQLTRQLLDNRLTAAELEQRVREAIQDRVGAQAIAAGGTVNVPLRTAAITAPMPGGAGDQAGPAGTPEERAAYIRRALDEQARLQAEQQALAEAARLRAIEDNARAEAERLQRAHQDAQAAEQARVADLARLEREAAEQEVLRLQQEQMRAQQNLTAWRAAALQQVHSKAAQKGIKNADAINQMNDLQLAAALGDINRVQQFINQDINAIEPVTGRSAVGFTGFIDNPGLRDQILDVLLAQGGDLFNAAPGTTRRQAFLSQSAKAMAQERALARGGRR